MNRTSRRSRATRALAWALPSFAVAAFLTACSSTTAPEPLTSTKPDQFTGKTLEYAFDRVDRTRSLVYDLSASIVHKEPTYNDGSAPDQWLIVANCTADNGIGLGIIPKDDATGTITRQVTTHKYNALLSECSTKGNDR